jgi:hypothetical protein
VYFAGAAGSVGDSPVERLEGQAVRRLAGHERVEPAAEPVDLDDVANRRRNGASAYRGFWTNSR